MSLASGVNVRSYSGRCSGRALVPVIRVAIIGRATIRELFHTVKTIHDRREGSDDD